MTDAVPAAVAEAQIEDEHYHQCRTCHKTIDIPSELYLRLDSGIFQHGQEVKAIDLNEDWYVGVYWCLLGRLAKILCVDWCVSVKFESMGEGEEFSRSYIVESEECERCWRHRFRDNELPVVVTDRECADVYRVVVVLSARDKCRKKPVGITGYCDLGLIEFYGGLTDTNS